MYLQKQRKQKLRVQSIIYKSKQSFTSKNRGSLEKSCQFIKTIIWNQQAIKAKHFSFCYTGKAYTSCKTHNDGWNDGESCFIWTISHLQEILKLQRFPWLHFPNSATTESESNKYLNHATHTVKLPSSLKKMNLSLTLQKYQLRPQGLCSGMGRYKDQTSCSSYHQRQHLNLCEDVTQQKSYSTKLSVLPPPTLMRTCFRALLISFRLPFHWCWTRYLLPTEDLHEGHRQPSKNEHRSQFMFLSLVYLLRETKKARYLLERLSRNSQP